MRRIAALWVSLGVSLGLVLGAGLAPVAAEDGPAYLDDRSTPERVIASLYNAVTRGEYPRAWSYWAEELRPDFDAFAAGYADTAAVRVRTGPAQAEGGMGKTWWLVPTVIEARRTDGSAAVFSGCYALRQTNPHLIERPPYDPIAIIRGRLRPTAKAFDAAQGDCAGI